MIQPILLLGDERLYEKSEALSRRELSSFAGVIEDLHDTLMDFRRRYGAGRAIAAPQIGVKKRLIYLNIGAPNVFINPAFYPEGGEMMEVMDDCMSFPGLFVKVMRHRRIVVEYLDMNWDNKKLSLEGDLAELFQHEYDHLDGILATMRAIDRKSYHMRPLDEQKI